MSKLSQFARGQECTLRLAPYCNHDPATVVACHLPFGNRGVGLKAPDWWTAHGCCSCHDIIDGRCRHDLDRATVLENMMRAHFETMRRYIAAGLITIKGVS